MKDEFIGAIIGVGVVGVVALLGAAYRLELPVLIGLLIVVIVLWALVWRIFLQPAIDPAIDG